MASASTITRRGKKPGRAARGRRQRRGRHGLGMADAATSSRRPTSIVFYQHGDWNDPGRRHRRVPRARRRARLHPLGRRWRQERPGIRQAHRPGERQGTRLPPRPARRWSSTATARHPIIRNFDALELGRRNLLEAGRRCRRSDVLGTSIEDGAAAAAVLDDWSTARAASSSRSPATTRGRSTTRSSACCCSAASPGPPTSRSIASTTRLARRGPVNASRAFKQCCRLRTHAAFAPSTRRT